MFFKRILDRLFKYLFLRMMNNKDNPYHPLVWINGNPKIGKHTYIGGFSEVNAKGAIVEIGRNCDIASFVAINVSDSHKKAIGISDKSSHKNITIGDNVFIGSHSVVLGGAIIENNCVIAAGTVVRSGIYPSYSLITNTDIKKGYFCSDTSPTS